MAGKISREIIIYEPLPDQDDYEFPEIQYSPPDEPPIVYEATASGKIFNRRLVYLPDRTILRQPRRCRIGLMWNERTADLVPAPWQPELRPIDDFPQVRIREVWAMREQMQQRDIATVCKRRTSKQDLKINTPEVKITKPDHSFALKR